MYALIQHPKKLILILATFIVPPVYADDLFVYPSKGQNAQQTEQDKFACYGWAKDNTGFDPMQRPQASTPPPASEPQTGGAGRGLARGAIGGAIIGEIADDDAGKGAAIGAVAGGLFGGMRRRDQQQKEQQKQAQWAQQEGARYEQQRHSYNRAYAACLEGRGYTVK